MALRLVPYIRAIPQAEATIQHTFPAKLKPKESIVGTITVTNNTAGAASWAVHVIPQWAPNLETATSLTAIPAGQSATFTFPDDFAPKENLPLLMPNQTANLTLRVVDGAGTVIAEITATIEIEWYQKLYFGIPLWMLMAGGAAFLIIVAAATRKK